MRMKIKGGGKPKGLFVPDIDDDDLEENPDAAYIEKSFEKIKRDPKNPTIKILEIDEETTFVQTDDGVFEGISEGKSKRSGDDLFTLGKPIREMNELILKKAKEEIKIILDENGESDDDDFENPFLPSLDE